MLRVYTTHLEGFDVVCIRYTTPSRAYIWSDLAHVPDHLYEQALSQAHALASATYKVLTQATLPDSEAVRRARLGTLVTVLTDPTN